MFHGREDASMHVLCLGSLSWNGHSSRVCILNKGDGAFQAGMVVVGPWLWDPWVQTAKEKKKYL